MHNMALCDEEAAITVTDEVPRRHEGITEKGRPEDIDLIKSSWQRTVKQAKRMKR
jgi:hypothetical protein